MRAAIVAAALLLAACGQQQRTVTRAAATQPSSADTSGAAVAPSDVELANQIASVQISNPQTDEGQQPGAATEQGDYYGQPLEERAQQRTLPQAHDNIWSALVTTRIGEDDAHGTFTATYSPTVRALVGRTLTISGFVMPLETTPQFRHFILTRYTPVCPFCPPGAPNEVVEVWSAHPIAQTNDLVRVTGQFALMNDAEKGLFFRLSDAGVASNAHS